jgi:PAS domain S-box-containing protein
VSRIPFPPGEGESLHASLKAVIKSSALRHDFEHRIAAKGSEIRWLRARWKIQRDERGRAARIVGVVTDVTAGKLAENELSARQEMLDLAQQAAKAAAFEWRIDTRKAGWSPQLEAMHGLAPGTYDGTHETWKSLIHPQDWPAVSAAIKSARETAQLEVQYRVVHPDGSLHWLQARGRLLPADDRRPGRMVGFMLDVTERRQAEAELERKKVILDELIASAPEAIIMCGPDWRVLRVNREFTRMFGYTPEEAVGVDFAWRVIPDDRAAEAEDARDRLGRGEHIVVETVRKRKDGSLFDVSVLGAPIWVAGEWIGAFFILRDITERKLAETEQASLEARLRQAEKMEAVGRLAGGIAHDFNNILAGILGYGEMVFAEAAEGTPMKRYARNLLTAANRARELVDQILTYSRSQRAKRTPVGIDRIVKETLELVRGSLPADIALALVLPAEPLIVVADPTQLHQVVMNLCTNAIHAMGGSGTLRVALESVDVAVERTLAQGVLAPGRYVRLTVADTGSGMDAATQARIFEPFFTTKEVGRGTGLGLPLVYGIVTDSGGAIHVASEPGRGSTFEIYLPRAEALTSVAEAASEPVPRGNGERVLLVDDEEPLVDMTAEVLAQLGYDSARFTDGRAALEAFENAPEAFQVVVTDEVMPALTGTELARRVHRLRPDLPVVLVSGYSGPILTQRALGAGVSELLKKPVQSRELAAALSRILHPPA